MQTHFSSSVSLGAAFTRKISISLVLSTAAVLGVEAATAPTPCAVTVASEAQLRTALTSTCNTAAGGAITLAADITATTGRFEYPGSGNGNLTLNGMGHTLSVTPGANFGVLSAGGAGTFTVDQAVITGGNASGRGGGIEAGNLIVSNSVINNNQAQDSGGGIAAENVTVTGSTISGNSSQSLNYGGGGIFADSVTIDRSTISGNSTPTDGFGGGIYGGSVTLIASTVSGNASNAGGGGISANTLTAINSTIADNNPFAMDGPAGAFYVAEQATLIFSTVAGNGSTQIIVGGFADPMPLTMIGSVVANPIQFGSVSQNCQKPAAHSTVSLEGYSKVSKWTCGLNINPWEVGLGPLGNNGGPTETMMPSNLYSAYDDLGTGVTTDQRGVPRPNGNFTLGSVQSSTQPPYAFQGFLPPVKAKGWTRIAAGQKVKLNWRLRDGATGRLVKDPKTKTSASYMPVDCRSGDAAPAEIPRTAVGPQVQWLKGTRQFLFRWQAPDLAGRCVRLDMSLADGSTHQARFRIKGRRASL